MSDVMFFQTPICIDALRIGKKGILDKPDLLLLLSGGCYAFFLLWICLGEMFLEISNKFHKQRHLTYSIIRFI